jgi:hypothetical protein
LLLFRSEDGLILWQGKREKAEPSDWFESSDDVVANYVALGGNTRFCCYVIVVGYVYVYVVVVVVNVVVVVVVVVYVVLLLTQV